MKTIKVPVPPIVAERLLSKIYPAITSLLIVWMVGSGLGAFGRLEFMSTAIERLGYPEYFHLLLGSAKILGAVAIVLPVPHMLREWAYAGVTFETIFATLSYLAVGSPIDEIIPPIGMLAFVLLAYTSWHGRLHLQQHHHRT